jgi:hypothetical protein
MKKLFLLIPATLIFNMTIAQDTKSEMTQKSATLDGKSFKITMTTTGNQGMNSETGDKMNPGTENKTGDMRNQDGTSMDKSNGSNKTQTNTDKNATAKTATLKFKNGMLKTSMSGPAKVKECSYTSTPSSASSNAISFTANCNNDGKSGSGKSMDNSGQSSNSSGDKTNSGISETTNTTNVDNTANSSNSSGTASSSSSTTTTGNSDSSQAEWSGTVTGNNISGTVKVMENGKNMSYSFTGTMMNKSDELGMGE